jgi:hypothetical protein
MMSLPSRFLALPASRRSLLLPALATVAIMRAALSLLQFASVCSALERIARMRGARRARSASALSIADVEWAVSRAARLVPRATCLTQALAIRAILARNGVASRMQIGVALPIGGSLRAHAWVDAVNSALAQNRLPSDFVPLAGPAFELISGAHGGMTATNQHEA